MSFIAFPLEIKSIEIFFSPSHCGMQNKKFHPSEIPCTDYSHEQFIVHDLLPLYELWGLFLTLALTLKHSKAPKVSRHWKEIISPVQPLHPDIYARILAEYLLLLMYWSKTMLLSGSSVDAVQQEAQPQSVSGSYWLESCRWLKARQKEFELLGKWHPSLFSPSSIRLDNSLAGTWQHLTELCMPANMKNLSFW